MGLRNLDGQEATTIIGIQPAARGSGTNIPADKRVPICISYNRNGRSPAVAVGGDWTLDHFFWKLRLLLQPGPQLGPSIIQHLHPDVTSWLFLCHILPHHLSAPGAVDFLPAITVPSFPLRNMLHQGFENSVGGCVGKSIPQEWLLRSHWKGFTDMGMIMTLSLSSTFHLIHQKT